MLIKVVVLLLLTKMNRKCRSLPPKSASVSSSLWSRKQCKRLVNNLQVLIEKLLLWKKCQSNLSLKPLLKEVQLRKKTLRKRRKTKLRLPCWRKERDTIRDKRLRKERRDRQRAWRKKTIKLRTEVNKSKTMMISCWLKLKWSSRMKSLITNLTTTLNLPTKEHPQQHLSKLLAPKSHNMPSKARRKSLSQKMKQSLKQHNQMSSNVLLMTTIRLTKPSLSLS